MEKVADTNLGLGVAHKKALNGIQWEVAHPLTLNYGYGCIPRSNRGFVI